MQMTEPTYTWLVEKNICKWPGNQNTWGTKLTQYMYPPNIHTPFFPDFQSWPPEYCYRKDIFD